MFGKQRKTGFLVDPLWDDSEELQQENTPSLDGSMDESLSSLCHRPVYSNSSHQRHTSRMMDDSFASLSMSQIEHADDKQRRRDRLDTMRANRDLLARLELQNNELEQANKRRSTNYMATGSAKNNSSSNKNNRLGFRRSKTVEPTPTASRGGGGVVLPLLTATSEISCFEVDAKKRVVTRTSKRHSTKTQSLSSSRTRRKPRSRSPQPALINLRASAR